MGGTLPWYCSFDCRSFRVPGRTTWSVRNRHGTQPLQEGHRTQGILLCCHHRTAARTVVLPFNYPFDTVRRRLMLESEKPAAERTYKSGIDCGIKVFQKEGLKGMY